MFYALAIFGLVSSAASPPWRESVAAWNWSESDAAWNWQDNSGWQTDNKRQHKYSAGYNVSISKYLSKLLRHHLQTFPNRLEDGSVPVDDVFARIQHDIKYATFKDIQDAVNMNDKSRFEMHETEGKLFIRAHQGHSKGSEVDAKAAMAPVNSGEILGGFVYHGTRRHNRNSIETNGLLPADRQHIHFFEPEHRDLGRNTGMYVRLDVEQYLQDGGELYRSGNNVILTPGLSNSGTIPPKYLSFCNANLHECASAQSQPSSSNKRQLEWFGAGTRKRW